MPRWNPVRVVSSLFPTEPGPRRSYALATLITTFGSGLLLGSLPLYFTRIVDLPAAQVGVGLTAAALVTLVTGLMVGEMADRRGPLEVVKAVLLLDAAAMFAFLFINNFVTFLLAATVHAVASSAVATAEGALLRRVAGDEAAGYRSSIHAITNLGLSLGLIPGGIAIQLGTATAFKTLIVLDVISFLVAWAVLTRLPSYPPLPKPATGPRWIALRDRPYVSFAVLAAAIHPQFYVLTLLLPLWVVEETNAPRWAIPLSLVINTILIIMLQVRLGGEVKTLRQGGNAWRRAGVFFLFSSSLLGLAAGLPSWAALLMVVAAVAVHTFGEIMHTSGGFALGMGLPPAHAQGQYDGVGGIIGGMGSVMAPALLLGVVLGLGLPGLLALGVFFLLPALLMPAVARWGERTRPDAAELVEAKPAGAVS
ncbi:MFS transporter [Micromonospora orduensis]|uniref:MFS transporter n=1 Tax=Micromonospora orduensis TaxID=1420891 RepID=A0A5C4QMP9_9ACTN|nr:MFS transporter [Micromonospora orduensis]TNH28024.1 MFS transporter [Micromonospora orduensis]